MKWAQRLEGIALGAFGDEMVAGMLLGFLDDSTPLQTYEHIRDDMPLLDLPDSDWEEAKSLAAHVNVEAILTRDKVLEILGRERSDLASVMLNTPNGMEWLDRQLATIRERLGVSEQD